MRESHSILYLASLSHLDCSTHTCFISLCYYRWNDVLVIKSSCSLSTCNFLSGRSQNRVLISLSSSLRQTFRILFSKILSSSLGKRHCRVYIVIVFIENPLLLSRSPIWWYLSIFLIILFLCAHSFVQMSFGFAHIINIDWSFDFSFFFLVVVLSSQQLFFSCLYWIGKNNQRLCTVFLIDFLSYSAFPK